MLESFSVYIISNFKRSLRILVGVTICIFLLGNSVIPPSDQTEQVRAFTRQIEFDYVNWTLNAIWVKFSEAALGTIGYFSADASRQIVLEYLQLVSQIQQIEMQIRMVYADPGISDPAVKIKPLHQQLDDLFLRYQKIAPLAETTLQSQVSYISDQFNLSLGGQPIPPVLYRSTPLPMALIISPRDIIRQEENISLLPDLPLDEQVELEEHVDQALDVSSLVVHIGGVGTYPTMVQQTTSLEWLSEVVAHEWVHNFLTLRPLGLNYMASPELRTMNETAASIAGKEIGLGVLAEFYPELLPPSPQETESGPGPLTEPLAFDFRKEMHETRTAVDKLLAEGRIEEAEEFMEARRKVFWENGFQGLRKLNQAYFAFYGAYADEPGGAAGEDPVGAAVRTLRARSPSLAAFLNQISWMYSYEQLQKAIDAG